mgnify:CR=1 FL=1
MSSKSHPERASKLRIEKNRLKSFRDRSICAPVDIEYNINIVYVALDLSANSTSKITLSDLSNLKGYGSAMFIRH